MHGPGARSAPLPRRGHPERQAQGRRGGRTGRPARLHKHHGLRTGRRRLLRQGHRRVRELLREARRRGLGRERCRGRGSHRGRALRGGAPRGLLRPHAKVLVEHEGERLLVAEERVEAHTAHGDEVLDPTGRAERGTRVPDAGVFFAPTWHTPISATSGSSGRSFENMPSARFRSQGA